MLPRAPTVGGAPAEKMRPWVRGAIAAIILLQALVPLRYYMGSDPYDERFSWRMFSAVRVHRCTSQAFDVGDGAAMPIDLSRTIHNAWIQMLSRNRADVVRAFLAHRCSTAEADAVRVVTRCAKPDGTEVPEIVWERDCETGAVDEPTIELGSVEGEGGE